MDEQFIDSDIPKPTPQYSVRAGFLPRVGAVVIDYFLFSIVGMLVIGAYGVDMRLLSETMMSGGDWMAVFGDKYLIVNATTLTIRWFYFAQQESSVYQATLGKRVVGLVVTDMDCQRVNFPQAALRAFWKEAYNIIPMFGLALNLPLLGILGLATVLGYFMQPFTEKKQALHDIIGKTLVFQKQAVRPN